MSICKGLQKGEDNCSVCGAEKPAVAWHGAAGDVCMCSDCVRSVCPSFLADVAALEGADIPPFFHEMRERFLDCYRQGLSVMLDSEDHIRVLKWRNGR